MFAVTEGTDYVGTISKDPRGAGYALYRINDHPRIDFTLAATHPDISFAHTGGFVAKTRTLDADVGEILELAVVEGSGVYIAVWADLEKTWCYLDELEQMTHMSDDYVTKELPITVETEDDLLAFIASVDV